MYYNFVHVVQFINKGDYMNERKQHVIKMAHQLFMEKGYQATSIQDILNYSGISKGTFYNYFSSKSELLIALFKLIYKQLEKDRNDLLIGQDPGNIHIFIKQVELQLETNRANKLISLFEEVIFSNDEELKQFIKKGHFRILRWTFYRFIDIFGENRRPYLLDCAVMFMGILQHNLKYNTHASRSNVSIHQIVRYSVDRIVKIVEETAEAGDQLLAPEVLDNWLPDCRQTDHAYQNEIHHTILSIKKMIGQQKEQEKMLEMLDFIQDEILDSKKPRKFMIGVALEHLKIHDLFYQNQELNKLNQLVSAYFTHLEEMN